ncbi:MAG: hypothetical protein ACLFVB_05075, partial [Thermoplasmata archaeon]
MIQIICDEDGNPEKVGYSQHYGGDKRSWDSDDVAKVDGTHPKVYVAKGGHASYYTENKKSLDDPRGDYGEEHTYRNEVNYKIQLLTNQNWLEFRGRWGEHGWPGPSPEGPVFR